MYFSSGLEQLLYFVFIHTLPPQTFPVKISGKRFGLNHDASSPVVGFQGNMKSDLMTLYKSLFGVSRHWCYAIERNVCPAERPAASNICLPLCEQCHFTPQSVKRSEI